jgi:two-component system, OmpR family, sensor histidine kinase KdpD
MDTPGESDRQQLHHHLLVCISTNTALAKQLIYQGRELASGLQADWTVLFIQRPAYHRYTQDLKDQMNQLLSLAESFGAKAETTFASSIPEEIISYARSHGFTTIMVGLPRKAWHRTTVVNGVIQRSDGIDVHVVAQTERQPHMRKRVPTVFSFLHYLYALGLVALVSLICFPLTDILDPTNIILFYLLAVVIAAVLWGLWPAVFTAAASVLAYDVLFVPPRFSITVADSFSIITFIVLFIVGVVVSLLITRARDSAAAACLGEQHVSTLYQLSEDLTVAVTIDDIAKALRDNIERHLPWKVAVLFKKGATLSILASSKDLTLDDKQWSEANWCLKTGDDIGLKTSPFTDTGLRFVPLKTSTDNYGVLAIKPLDSNETLTIEQDRILHSYASLAALATSRVRSSSQ